LDFGGNGSLIQRWRGGDWQDINEATIKDAAPAFARHAFEPTAPAAEIGGSLNEWDELQTAARIASRI
jgi:hypothetical protein